MHISVLTKHTQIVCGKKLSIINLKVLQGVLYRSKTCIKCTNAGLRETVQRQDIENRTVTRTFLFPISIFDYKGSQFLEKENTQM
jgi:hypothetical protein